MTIVTCIYYIWFIVVVWFDLGPGLDHVSVLYPGVTYSTYSKLSPSEWLWPCHAWVPEVHCLSGWQGHNPNNHRFCPEAPASPCLTGTGEYHMCESGGSPFGLFCDKHTNWLVSLIKQCQVLCQFLSEIHRNYIQVQCWTQSDNLRITTNEMEREERNK